MGPARVGITAVSLAALVGHITSEVPPVIEHAHRETYHQSGPTESDLTMPRRRRLRSAAVGQLHGDRHNLCPSGSGITVTSTKNPVMEGCLVERDLFRVGEVEFVGSTGKIAPRPAVGGERYWFAILNEYQEAYDLDCHSEELASLVHPSEATWRCIAGDGAVFYPAGSEFSVVCGCNDAPELSTAPESQAQKGVPVCERNGIPGIESPGGAVCCVAGCNTCGGAGCWSVGAEAGLTADDCCATEILAYGEACSKIGNAPCYVDDGSLVDSEVEDDGPCSVSALSAIAMEQLSTYDRGLYRDPDCDNDVAFLPAYCNFMGLGQRCRGCFMSLAGARKYTADFADDMLDWGEEVTINFCPGTDLEGFSTK